MLLAVVAVLAYLGVDEFHTSRWQARWFHRWAQEATWQVKPGPSSAIRFPGPGPYDMRLGYTQLPQFTQRLQARGYDVIAQASWSQRMLSLRDLGLFPPYHEKNQTGLDLADCRGAPLFQARSPARVYGRYADVPPVLVDSLLFVENRELLSPEWPTRNPAIEWDRFTKAALDQARRLVDDSHRSPGGSTLLTQIEKYRHSPEGRTESGREKLRQMASASLRAYLAGEDTRGTRHQIVVDYLDTVPLSAQSGFGEVNGLGDGLWVWYGREFAEVNRLLAQPLGGNLQVPAAGTLASAASHASRHTGRERHDSRADRARHPNPAHAIAPRDPSLLAQQALAYKQALSLIIAQRRPSYYLGDGEASLRQLTDSYLRVMADAGVIPPALRDAALPLPLKRRLQPPQEATESFVGRKAATALRTHLSQVLALPRAYDLDRLDLQARSTLDGQVQVAARDLLRSLGDNASAHQHGLYGFRLLSEGDDTSKLVLSFTLYERTPQANLLRVQTDNLDQPFDLNEGARLDLGSTAKLRTLVTYLQQVARLHEQWGGLGPDALKALKPSPKDPIGLWARDWLLQARQGEAPAAGEAPSASSAASQAPANTDRADSLKAMLEAALERTYSGDPGETFFTGGGAHHFVNFESEEDHQTFTVRKALWHSVNLVFIRLMRDVVHHAIYGTGGVDPAVLEDEHNPKRQDYLARFADNEGAEFLVRFYRQYTGRTPEAIEQVLLKQLRPVPSRLAAAFYGMQPTGNLLQLAHFIEQRTGKRPDERELKALEAKYGPGRWSLADRAFVAGVHPLDLWVAGYLRHYPNATWTQTLGASHQARQDAYAWLFKTHSKPAQDVRIREVIEQDGFAKILADWKRVGYPFDSITPSYATALGASGDRPASLAELMGILVNHGLKLPVVRVGALDFAKATPYETAFQVHPGAAQRMMPADVADAVIDAAQGVVKEGTAGRLNGVFKKRDGTVVPVGGKTGTGDHRYDVFGPGGALISSRVIDRSGTFVFYIGDRYFGTMMVYAHEPYAAHFKFTSALPAQLLKALAPTLLPLLDDQRTCPALPGIASAAAPAGVASGAAVGTAAGPVSTASAASAASAGSAPSTPGSSQAASPASASASPAASAASARSTASAPLAPPAAPHSAAPASSRASAAATHAASSTLAATATASATKVAPATAPSASAPPAKATAPVHLAASAAPAAASSRTTSAVAPPHAASAASAPSPHTRVASAPSVTPVSAAVAHAPHAAASRPVSPASAGSASSPPSSPPR